MIDNKGNQEENLNLSGRKLTDVVANLANPQRKTQAVLELTAMLSDKIMLTVDGKGYVMPVEITQMTDSDNVPIVLAKRLYITNEGEIYLIRGRKGEKINEPLLLGETYDYSGMIGNSEYDVDKIAGDDVGYGRVGEIVGLVENDSRELTVEEVERAGEIAQILEKEENREGLIPVSVDGKRMFLMINNGVDGVPSGKIVLFGVEIEPVEVILDGFESYFDEKGIKEDQIGNFEGSLLMVLKLMKSEDLPSGIIINLLSMNEVKARLDRKGDWLRWERNERQVAKGVTNIDLYKIKEDFSKKRRKTQEIDVNELK